MVADSSTAKASEYEQANIGDVRSGCIQSTAKKLAVRVDLDRTVEDSGSKEGHWQLFEFFCSARTTDLRCVFLEV